MAGTAGVDDEDAAVTATGDEDATGDAAATGAWAGAESLARRGGAVAVIIGPTAARGAWPPRAW
ncbi:hypothetical protein GCM10009590_11860 [Brachybacterium alimentarium]